MDRPQDIGLYGKWGKVGGNRPKHKKTASPLEGKEG